MNIFLILFVVGLIFVIMGYSNQFTIDLTDEDKMTFTTKYVPRNVYDDLVLSSELSN